MGRILDKNIKAYWLVISILIILVIFLSTAKFGTPQEIINQISFAATISSILLALVTIIFAVSQLNKSSEHEAIITNSLQEINQRIMELNYIKDDLLTLKNTTTLSHDTIQEMLRLLDSLPEKIYSSHDTETVQDQPNKVIVDKEQLLDQVNKAKISLEEMLVDSYNDALSSNNFDDDVFNNYLSSKEQNIIQLLEQYPEGLTASQISTYLQNTHQSTMNYLVRLGKKRLIKKETDGRVRKYILIDK